MSLNSLLNVNVSVGFCFGDIFLSYFVVKTLALKRFSRFVLFMVEQHGDKSVFPVDEKTQMSE